jgi:hypothetical protein
MFPPRARKTGDQPGLYRIAAVSHHDRNRVGRFFDSMSRIGSSGDNQIDLQIDKLTSESRESIGIGLAAANFHDHVFSLDIAQLSHASAKCINKSCAFAYGRGHENPEAVNFFGLLRRCWYAKCQEKSAK